MDTPSTAPAAIEQHAIAGREKRRRAAQRRLRVILPFLLMLVFLVYAFTTNFIPTGSMLPNLRPGDHVLTMRSWLAYPGGRMPAVGDVVVFLRRTEPAHQAPEADDTGGGQRRLLLFREPPGTEVLIKRVVALEGDVVQIVGSDVYVNGQVQQPWWQVRSDPAGSLGAFYGVIRPVQLGPGEIYVLGDNRGQSDDSRFWGPLKRPDVLGRFVRVLYNEGADGPNVRRAAREEAGGR
ncbi:MAG TPA: signal peptidase I [Chthonomonadales bacterium]|nr:signal peptidase I [Chthonomonadales bacterium]